MASLTAGLQKVDRMLEKTKPTYIIAGTVVGVWAAGKVRRMVQLGREECTREAKEAVLRVVRRYLGSYLGVDKAIDDAVASFNKAFMEKQGDLPVRKALPSGRCTVEDVLRESRELVALNTDFTNGQFSGCVYHNGDEGYTAMVNEVMAMFQWTNPMHAGQFTGVRRMEIESIAMVVDMFHGGPEACGCITSGGTESVILAMKAYRDWGRAERGITEPEIVAPITAHPCFEKAASYMGIRIRYARLVPGTEKGDVDHMRRLITRNTVCLVGSAPSFPHGIVDPIEAIGELGVKYGIPVHVDACLGGFVVAFMEEAGCPLPERFDFRVDGVTSISCDTHKYGFAPKGSSIVMYRNKKLRRYQMTSSPNWPGGVYASPTIAGSRPGNIVAGTWAALMYHGREGYVATAKAIVETTRHITKECADIPGLKVVGEPLVSVVAFASEKFDVFRLFQMMTERHWELNNLQFPSAFHLCVTAMHTKEKDGRRYIAERFITDMRELCAELMKDPSAKPTGSAALYGTTQEIPDRSIIADVSKMYFDAYYNTDAKADYEKAVGGQ